MELSDIASALASVAPYAGPIEAVADLGIDITKLITPDQAQTYDQAHQDRLKKAADLVSALVENPGPDAARDLNTFDDDLCIAAGFPITGGISTQLVTIRVDRLLAHYAAISAGIRDEQFFHQLSLGAKQQQQAAGGGAIPRKA